MADGTETTQVSLDSPLVSMQQYKAARESGATTTIEKSQLENVTPPEVTGEEESKDYKEKRQEQQGKNRGGGFQKRIDRLVKEKALLQERLARYESANGNSTHQEESLESSPAERQAEPERTETPEEEPKVRALKQRYPDWDRVMERARNERMRISDDAANVMRSSDNAGHIAYMLASNEALRNEFNKLPSAQQVEQIRQMDRHIAFVESGGQQDADRFKRGMAELSKKHSDFKELVSAAHDIKIPEAMSRQILSLENGPDVTIYLARNPKIAQELADMDPKSSERELWRISGQVEAHNGEKLVSKAPPPIRPVSGGFSRSSVPLDEMDMEAYKKARAAGQKR